MKREDLEAMGLSKEQIDKVLDAHHKELDPVQKELTKAQEDLKAEQGKTATQKETIDGLNKSLDEFKGADVSGMKKQITDLEAALKAKDEEHSKAIADRDFQDILKEAITAAKGRNAKAITALLDVETLKSSKNQKDDIEAALKELSEKEDGAFLFGDSGSGAENIGSGNPIGSFARGNSGDDLSAMRAAMGLPAEAKK